MSVSVCQCNHCRTGRHNMPQLTQNSLPYLAVIRYFLVFEIPIVLKCKEKSIQINFARTILNRSKTISRGESKATYPSHVSLAHVVVHVQPVGGDEAGNVGVDVVVVDGVEPVLKDIT